VAGLSEAVSPRSGDCPELLSEQTRQLYAALPSVLVITLVVALLLVGMHWQMRPAAWLLGWLGGYGVLSALRLWLLQAYRKRAPVAETAVVWYARFRALSILSALFWGAGAWLFFVPDAPGHRALLAFVIAGLGAGGVVNLAPRWQCAWLFILPALVPYAVRFALLDEPLANEIALFIAVYIVALLAMSLQFSRSIVRHIREGLERAEQAEASRREHQRYQSLVESTRAIIWEGDAETFAFTYISPEAEQLLGYPAKRWVGGKDFWVNHMHPDDRDWAPHYCRLSTERLTDHVFDYRMLAADGRTVWLRDVVKVMVRDGRAEKLVGVMIDISELKQAEQEAEYVSGLQRLVVSVSRDLVGTYGDDLTPVFDPMLERLGHVCRVDRAYLIKFDTALETFTNTHEWVADGVSRQMHTMQAAPTGEIPRILETLAARRPVHITDVAALGEDWAGERVLLSGQDIQSMICLPVHAGERLIGLIGFDAVTRKRRWSDEEAAVLQVLGDLIGAVLERRLREKQLRNSERLRVYAESLAGMGSWEWEVGSEDFHASEEWRRVTGCGDGPLSRTRVLELTPADERPRVEARLRASVERGETYDIEHRIVRPDTRELRWVKVHAEYIERPEQPAMLRGFAQDITERKRAEEKLFELAHYDSLTGLPNRLLVVDRLQQALKRARREHDQVAVLFLDLDQFKRVNDTQGHDAGDEALVLAARRLQGLFRERDTVARIGGDEFVILLEQFRNISEIIAASGKVLDAFREPFSISGREFTLTASIGIAVSPHDGTRAWDLMRHADTAMYHAKHGGRDGYQFFTRSMNEQLNRQLKIEQALRGAVARGEFSVAYQPLYRLADRVCVGAEALLRWRHPELGEVAPPEFIAVAEQAGLIAELGWFVIDDALERVAGWRRRRPAFCVSVNVSPRQFRDARIAEYLAAALDRAGLEGDALELEVTEGLLLSGRREVHHALKTLRARGVGIVMDDFGTGYASLSYLRDYPFSSLKIDRSFICNLEGDPRNRQLINSALRLGRALEMKVVAEGVETEVQLDTLFELGCELAQGFLLGRPMPAAEFEALL